MPKMKIDFHKLKSIHYGTAILILVPTLMSSAGFIFMYGRNWFVSLDTTKLILLSFSIGAPYWLIILFWLQTFSSLMFNKKLEAGLLSELDDLEDDDLYRVSDEIFEEFTKSNAVTAGYFAVLAFSITFILRVFQPITLANGIIILLSSTAFFILARNFYDWIVIRREIRDYKGAL